MRRERLYLLRIWSDSDGVTVWRTSIEDLRTRRQQHFEDLDALRNFLTTKGVASDVDPERDAADA